ncbi:branched-chain amino acid aminotransferase [Robiginitalea myxolifaciens]|uniref:branched-chain-amino-acid transaminase n=1 Tax=Robiginitalea myxolifaciens TaxID=400055 RepID=A0A1I6H191_9FLAO|nr:aminotransferase class IV [Robiginitalea myxolifaciens]SFR48225.1 branched-chain amino acid aminotransferase [Robiginitalea myxolifaciens]
MSTINLDGDLLPADSHFLNHQNRGLRYGDALFETIRYTGAELLFWEDHYFRLMSSMRRLRMEIPMSFTMEFLEEEIRKGLQADGVATQPARIRLTVFRKEGGRYTPEDRGIRYIVEHEPLSKAAYELETGDNRADLYKDYYLHADELTGLKHSNKIVHVLAGIYTRENDMQTCFLLNHNKSVAEALDGNIFLVRGKEIKTPPLADGALDGILRKQLLKLGATDSEYQWVEASISPFELQQADELFATNVIRGIRPITAYRKATYGHEVAERVLNELNQQIAGQES